jgi:hypothetical protein
MRQLFSKSLSVVAAAGAQAWASVANLRCVSLLEDARSYRPEAHYMRGPGPKWRAKHAAAQSDAEMSMKP